MLMVPLSSMSAAAGSAIEERFGPFLSAGRVHDENLALRAEIQDLKEQLIDYETVKMETSSSGNSWKSKSATPTSSLNPPLWWDAPPMTGSVPLP